MSKKETIPETNPDLDQLRNILYGNQARATESRLDDLEARLETVRRELSEDLNKRAASLSNSSSSQLNNTQQTLVTQIEQMATDFNQRLSAQIATLNQQLADSRADSRQRDNDLRQEMLTLGAMIDKQKTGREELGTLLVQLGTQLQKNAIGNSSKTKQE